MDGTYKEYHKNGKLKMKGNYIRGKQEGLFKRYAIEGKLKDVIIYEKGLNKGIKTFEKGEDMELYELSKPFGIITLILILSTF